MISQMSHAQWHINNFHILNHILNSCLHMSIAKWYEVAVFNMHNRLIGGWENKSEGSQPGIQAQRPRTRTARTTRQINGAKSFSG